MHHLTYLPSQAVMLMAQEQCYDVAPHWSPHRRECRDSGKLVAFAVSRSVRVLLAYLDARNRSSDSPYVIGYIENPECSYTCSYIDEKFLPKNSPK